MGKPLNWKVYDQLGIHQKCSRPRLDLPEGIAWIHLSTKIMTLQATYILILLFRGNHLIMWYTTCGQKYCHIVAVRRKLDKYLQACSRLFTLDKMEAECRCRSQIVITFFLNAKTQRTGKFSGASTQVITTILKY